jgi:general secretion pathway protein D
LASAFAGSQGSSEIRVGDLSVPISPPTIPGAAAMGAGATSVALIDGSVDGFDVRAAVRMLSQRTGSDLLSAPKLTVLSGHQATINVAQEIRYPDSYGDTQSDVGRGGTGDAGAAGVTITPGTPQDFQMRRVGVELMVTPTVEQDNSVTLDLNPRVTEFEGFVEFGGVGLAISGGQVVTIPSGFYQPVFATRELNTKVNIWDGATVVMGGLTREDVRRVSDKTPFLGDIPLLGRFFRSEGEGSQKRNLLVFVTANLVSPGGSPMRQQLRNVEPGALFQNPTVVLPGGAVSREKREE